MMKRILLLTALATWALTTSCKSKGDMPEPTPDPVQPTPPTPTPTPTPPIPTPTPLPTPGTPTDYDLATRMTVQLRDGKEADFLRTLKIEELAWGGERDAVTLADLLPFVVFTSSGADGKPYRLTDDDLKQLKLADMRYEEGADGADHLAFKTTYKGIASHDVLRLPVSRRAYFLQRIQPDPAFVPAHYVAGVANQLGIFAGEIFKGYDRSRYAVGIQGGFVSHSENTLLVRTKINLPRYRKEAVVTLDFQLRGFRPLSSLVGRLAMFRSKELTAEVHRRLAAVRPLTEATIQASLQPDAMSWIKHAQFAFKADNGRFGLLLWGANHTLLLGNTSGGIDSRDFALEKLRFAVQSVRYDRPQGLIFVTVELTSANDQTLSGVTARLEVSAPQ